MWHPCLPLPAASWLKCILEDCASRSYDTNPKVKGEQDTRGEEETEEDSAQLQREGCRKTALLPLTGISAVVLPKKEVDLCISLCNGKRNWWRTKHMELPSHERPRAQGRTTRCWHQGVFSPPAASLQALNRHYKKPPLGRALSHPHNCQVLPEQFIAG